MKVFGPSGLWALSLLCSSSSGAPLDAGHPQAGISYFNNNTVFQAPPNYTVPGTLYARTVQLADLSFLATWENYSPEPPSVYFPIYRSTDFGKTWSELSRVQDTSGNNYGMRYQPFLYVLPQDWSTWKAGTVFLAGSSIPTDLSSTDIQLYASTDSGVSWQFVSSIAKGGEAVPDNGLTPVWEPFLMLYNDMLVCYYSDQRDPAHGQKLVHQTTTDGKAWSDVVDDVAYSNYTDRPGMPVVAQMGKGSSATYIMTYEYGGGPVDGVLPVNYTFPVFYKISSDPTAFRAVEGQPIVTNDESRTVPVSSPYVIYDEKEDMIIVSCGTLSDVFVNHAGGDVGAWESRTTGERVSYTRSLRIIYDQSWERALLLAGGGKLPPSEGNEVTVGVVDIQGW
ncbi:hypothetical protein PV05_12020 [Exophiala xenobiotica]|uniref:Sialidase domain-containing protein n=1 Tax=Exophiala xenobiotica TaxID=348802 RepID=A0A0D2E4U3_9EURO|nr:uncharacterized protein PV05_12020 [Exophiala xenobiotica]KIW50433.1 hypothetical protein PV05_12020 [Exophiala xenobiotica]